MISIWEKEAFFAPQDVLIIGSGFAGLWSALYLKKKAPKAKITILDKGLLPFGASTRNAGFACFGSLSELMDDSKTMGVDAMLELVELRFKGLKTIEKTFKKEIDFELTGGYELFSSPASTTLPELKNSSEYLNALLKPVTGEKNTFTLADEKISDFGFTTTSHLVKNSLEGYLHSGKLLRALLQKVQSVGVLVVGGMEVKNIQKRGTEMDVITNGPFHFSGKKVLVATNAFATDLLPEAGIVPARGQVLLTSPIKSLPFKGTFHSEEGFYYFRNLGNRVLLGGARNKAFAEEETTNMALSQTIQENLENYLKEIVLPNCTEPFEIEHRWAGIMGMAKQKTPVVKQVTENLFCVVGLGGMGVAVAPVLGKKAAKTVG